MHVLPLSEWVELKTETQDIPTENDLMLAACQRSIDKISNIPVSLPSTTVSDIVTANESATQQFVESYNNALAGMPKNPFETLSEENKAALDKAGIPPYKLPPAKLHATELSITDYAFITGSTGTKVDITISLAQQEIEAWQVLRAQCSHRIQTLEAELADLNNKRDLLKEAQSTGQQFFSHISDVGKQIDRAKEEIKPAMENGLIKDLLNNPWYARRSQSDGPLHADPTTSDGTSSNPGRQSLVVNSYRTDSPYLPYYYLF
jgi:hypothetical protein